MNVVGAQETSLGVSGRFRDLKYNHVATEPEKTNPLESLNAANQFPLAIVDPSINNHGDDATYYNTASPHDAPAAPGPEHVYVYKRRWLMLTLFGLYSFSNAVQWIHLNIIYNVLIRYYNDSLPADPYQRDTAIDWLSMVYMLVYIPLIFPATWLLDKKGLRICNVVGSLLNAMAAWIKCASVGQKGACLFLFVILYTLQTTMTTLLIVYWITLACVSSTVVKLISERVVELFPVLMFAQTIAAISQLWVLGIPARLAAVWFGPTEVSTATSLGVFGNQVGIAIGFLAPPALVPNSESLDTIGTNLRNMFFGTAAITTAIFLLNLILFQNQPPNPPSHAQQRQLELEVNANYGKSLVNLFKNKGFLVLMISYGMNTGSFYAVSTLLNPIVLDYFQNEEENAGRIGLTLVLAGIVGAVVAGIILDRTKTFKATSIVIYLLTTVSMAIFTSTLSLNHLWIVFVTGGLLGLTMTGYLPVGFEFAAELTFPESEGTSSGLLNASAQIFGIILTLGMRAMMNRFNTLSANITVTAILLLGTIMTCFIKADYRRQAAGKEIQEKLSNVEIATVTVKGELGSIVKGEHNEAIVEDA